MDLTPDRAASAVERHDCPNCDAPAGSACRTRGGKTAAKYHTPRFVLVPALREELEIPVPPDRLPGRAWKQGPALAVVPAPRAERPVRIGYARTSTARQELASQLEALHRAECHKVFKEQISTRIKVRPELEAALALARQFKEAAPQTPVIFTVHELKRLARNAAELMTLSAELQAGGIQLELLTEPLTGIYDPDGMGALFFAVLAVAGQIERNYIREKTLEGQVTAAAKGNHGGRPKVIDDDMLTFAVALKDKGVPVPEIAKKLTIKTGKNAGKHPSVASLYRALAEAEEAAVDDHLPLRPKPVRIRRPGDPLTAEEIALRERLQSQPHPNTEIRSE
ncbi:recombinase family protein [Streptomyces sp. CJ_13]|uniref:recombinase family protein n=1 Tax=Streptomyces sp. CJ_13 TaxID=2724943 RepID=UPI001BDCEFFC|nr:recombinase family protein [Streptomyces sp. CJ_13]MBT1189909.1 recombinase family protein [Streptomyces sp. CJ_13]